MQATVEPHVHRPRRVLVVEDDPAISRSLMRALTSGGFTASAVHSCAAARSLSGHFDWAVLDLDLADGNGATLAHELLARSMASNIVFFTGSSDPMQLARARDLGRLLPKSHGVNHLLAVLCAAKSEQEGRVSHTAPPISGETVIEPQRRDTVRRKRAAR